MKAILLTSQLYYKQVLNQYSNLSLYTCSQSDVISPSFKYHKITCFLPPKESPFNLIQSLIQYTQQKSLYKSKPFQSIISFPPINTIYTNQSIIIMYKLLCLLVLAFIATSFTLQDDHCPHDQEVLCIDDINKAYPPCLKAAQAKGKDLPADLDCMKYSLHVEKDCWPCICLVAHTAGWKIKGC